VKVTIDGGSTCKTIELNDLSTMRANYNINSDVKFDDEGYPTFTTIKVASNKIITDLANRLGLMI
jgi:hypothetical protein